MLFTLKLPFKLIAIPHKMIIVIIVLFFPFRFILLLIFVNVMKYIIL